MEVDDPENGVHKVKNISKKLAKMIIKDSNRLLRNDRTGLVYDESMAEHYCLWDPHYPECPERFTRSLQRCKDYGLVERCTFIKPRYASEEEIKSVHSDDLLEMVKATQNFQDKERLEKLSSKFDSTYFHPKTYELALLAAGSILELVSAVLENKVQNGMAIIRPPGHHAMHNEVCGYCYFNNIAISANHALQNYGLQRILIVDWDVHHGQGTQFIFYNDPRVLYFSIHRYEEGAFWPELKESNFDWIGEGPGKGYNINVPLNKTKMTNGDYIAIFNNILLPVAYEFCPELVLVSSGYDAAFGCPEGDMELTPQVFPHLLNCLMGLSGGHVCVALEGGYCLTSLSEGVALTLRHLLGDPCPDIGPVPPPCESAVASILSVLSVLRPYWRSLCLQNRHIEEKEDGLEKRRFIPKIEYKGVLGKKKPDIYSTSSFYPIHSSASIAIIEEKLKALVDETDLYVPPNFTCLVFDNKMTLHRNTVEKWHPEKPDRINCIYNKLKERGLVDRCLLLESRYATSEELALVHCSKYISKMKTVDDMKSDEIAKFQTTFQSVYLCQETYNSASLAVGCLLQAVDSVMSRLCQNGIALIRPPGHHAEKEEACGFCVFNSVAVAAKYALANFPLKRVLIIDWDVHHGNGIQHIFYNDPKVLYISLHRYDHGLFFPCSPDANYDAVGQNKGKGFNMNIPWNKGSMGDGDYLASFFHLVLPVVYQFNPELILVACGFDAAKGDPLGGCKVTPQCYGHMIHLLSSLANGKIVLALEGGYNLNSISEAMAQCTSVLLGDPPSPLNPSLKPSVSAMTSIQSVLSVHKEFWSCLKFDVNLPSYKPQPRALEVRRGSYESSSNGSLNSTPSPGRSSPVPIAGKEEEPERKKSFIGLLELPHQEPEDGACGGEEPTKETSPVPENFFCVTPLDWCPHLELLQSLPPEGMDPTASCQMCSDPTENWICLHCYQVYCGRFINQHMLQHGRELRHSLTLSFTDLSVWCYACDSYVHNEVLEPAIKEAYLKKFGVRM